MLIITNKLVYFVLSGYDERDGTPKNKVLALVKKAYSRADVQLRAEW